MSAPDVLVTGSAGHLGCAFMLSLPSLGHTPIGIDIRPSETTTHVGCITNRPFIAALFTQYPTIKHILHAATLHKPHVGSHAKSDFVNVNIAGTLVLLEESAKLGPQIDSFVFISTTSTFGKALSPREASPAAWIDESVVPVPKNIYGVTKVAAEDLCRLVQAQTGMPVLVLRTSRFFPEADDDEDRRSSMADENLKVLELAYRRVDIADVVSACVCAMQRARHIGWGRYIVSSPPPFRKEEGTLQRLNASGKAGVVLQEVVPGIAEALGKKGWKFLQRFDRVYDSTKTVEELGWRPTYTIQHAVGCILEGKEWRSDLTFKVGKKGYHNVPTGVYTVR
ncbi:NAD dependent epimerase/dehydratase family protein [Sodiomyces alkalinus F11]|uniref:NAD dependent epimerase/dehydratase family protein n=1 Tax=Sodiomyces alkalinus (strain CBS 110278 / VKM F-3762 / F11) TaxID=1314773 RepID=A0A3N2PL04_SODAK|nr:NAD dependent epimerase/dehydratase family protein [Sodiomyces alkalinus F11]ROT35100.1 NAD dependent epimerase/dehydratase family protein [Sodiomyces alkalinus F11]